MAEHRVAVYEALLTYGFCLHIRSIIINRDLRRGEIFPLPAKQIQNEGLDHLFKRLQISRTFRGFFFSLHLARAGSGLGLGSKARALKLGLGESGQLFF